MFISANIKILIGNIVSRVIYHVARRDGKNFYYGSITALCDSGILAGYSRDKLYRHFKNESDLVLPFLGIIIFRGDLLTTGDVKNQAQKQA